LQVVFDLDGVIRDLSPRVFGYVPPTWNHKNVMGQNLFEIIDEDPECLVEAKPSIYLDTIRKHVKEPIILTHQLDWWIPYTWEWIKKHLIDMRPHILFLAPQVKVEFMKTHDCFIVEDSPIFPCYEKVLLIDHPYNRHVTPYARITTPKELEGWLHYFENKKNK
jgi:hypothetical protein